VFAKLLKDKMNEFSNALNDKINIWHNCRIGQATAVLLFTDESANVIGNGGTTKKVACVCHDYTIARLLSLVD
jgi:hypothetical protein